MSGYRFEWDVEKAASNVRKHGVTFEEASTAFRDPLALLMTDPITRLAKSGILYLGCRAGKDSWWSRLPSGHLKPA